MPAENTYREEFKIRAYEVGTDGYLTIQSVCNYLQEVAGNHATRLGVAVDKLFKQNLTWVLSRLHVRMHKYPPWRQKIRILTWPSDAHGLFAIRDFLLYNQNDEIIGQATTSWMLLDFKKMRPIAMPDFIHAIDRPQRPRAIDDVFDKLPRFEKKQYQKFFNVRLSDLDMNNHVNNVHYIEWALETIPVEIKNKKKVAQLEVSFRAESNYGDKIVSQSVMQQDSETFLHRVSREKDNRELSVLRTVWK